MDHRDHVRLIARGVPPGGAWADLGAGEGAFTLALRDVAGPDVVIYAVDKLEDGFRTPEAAPSEHSSLFAGRRFGINSWIRERSRGGKR